MLCNFDCMRRFERFLCSFCNLTTESFLTVDLNYGINMRCTVNITERLI